MNKLNRNDLANYYYMHEHFKRGYVCYQDDGKSRASLIELGYNSGVYGWNWSLFLDPETDTLYCSSYRNVPNYLIEK